MRRPNFFPDAIADLLALSGVFHAAGGAGTLVLLAPALSSSSDEKCNRARDSELPNFAETARELQRDIYVYI